MYLMCSADEVEVVSSQKLLDNVVPKRIANPPWVSPPPETPGSWAQKEEGKAVKKKRGPRRQGSFWAFQQQRGGDLENEGAEGGHTSCLPTASSTKDAAKPDHIFSTVDEVYGYILV